MLFIDEFLEQLFVDPTQVVSDLGQHGLHRFLELRKDVILKSVVELRLDDTLDVLNV